MSHRPRRLRQIALAASVLLAVAGVTQSSQQRPPAKRSPVVVEQEPRIRREVSLVTVLVSVLDAQGRPVPDLPVEAFTLLEEGIEQKIAVFERETQQPLDLVLMIDTSLSTLKELEFERTAAARFIRQVLRSSDRLSVFQFSDDVVQLSEFRASLAQHQAALQRVEPGAGTVMYDAIVLAAKTLDARPPGRRRVIILVTDAGESTSLSRFEDARRAALEAEAMLYAIIVRPVRGENARNTAGEHAIITINDTAGGNVYFPDSMESLPEIFDRIDRELRTQYRLAYYPNPRPASRGFHRIELRVTPPPAAAGNSAAEDSPSKKTAYDLRYRKGYYTD